MAIPCNASDSANDGPWIIEKYLDTNKTTFCFELKLLSPESAFDALKFLRDCHALHPMEQIHNDLEQVQSALENQLIEIINEDYSEFLHLSSHLKNVSDAIASIRSPLSDIMQCINKVDASMSILHQKVAAQSRTLAELEEEEAILNVHIKISEKLLLLESLLDISADSAEIDNVGILEERLDDGFAITTCGEDTLQICARLERVAQGLLFLQPHFRAESENHMLKREEYRLVQIKEILLQRLEAELATEVSPDLFYAHKHSLDTERMGYLLRSYVLLEMANIPEDMISKLLTERIIDKYFGAKESLRALYDSLLSFIKDEFRNILTLPVCQGTDVQCSVDLMGNAIWKPICAALLQKLPNIFKIDDLDRFRRNYVLSMSFLKGLEELCMSDNMKMRLLNHESTFAFKKKWDIKAYWQACCRQLSARVENSFSMTSAASDPLPDSVYKSTELQGTTFKALWDSLERCWSDDVYLSPLATDMLRFSLQLLQYNVHKWRPNLETALSQCENKAKISTEFLSTKDDILCAAVDLHRLQISIQGNLVSTIAGRLEDNVPNALTFVQKLLDEPMRKLEVLENIAWSAGIVCIADDCKKVLPALRSVKGQYQMTNKDPPTSPSIYVASVLRPLRDFFARWGNCQSSSLSKAHFCQNVFDQICELFHTISAEVLNSASELEESLRNRKALRNDKNSTAQLSDTDKMRKQLLLDIYALQSEIKELAETETIDSSHFDSVVTQLSKN